MCSLYSICKITTNVGTGWSNSRRQFAKSVKYSVCANNVVMPSRKPMNHKPECCRLTTQREKEEDMVRWPVAGTNGLKVRVYMQLYGI